MKKILTIVVVMMFLVSMLPLAAGVDVNGDDGSAPQQGENAGDQFHIMESEKGSGAGARGERMRERAQEHAQRGAQQEIRQQMREQMQAAREDLRGKAAEMRREFKGLKGDSGAQVEKRKELWKDFREHQKEMLMTAVEKCKQMNLGEKCEEKFKKRTELIEKLAEKDVERLKNFEERRKEHEQNFLELKQQFNLRTLAPELKEKLKAEFEQAKEKFKEGREEHKTAVNAFKEAKILVKDACKEVTSDACKKAQEASLTKAKEVLGKSVTAAIDHIKKIKAKVQATPGLSEQEVKNYVAKFDEKITALEGLKANVISTATKEEIKALAQQIRDQLKDTDFHARRGINNVAIKNMAGVLVQLKQLQVRLDRALARMTEEGKDTTAVEALVNEFNGKLDTAKQKFSVAEAKFTEFQTTKNVALSTEAHAQLKEAHQALQQAREILQKIVQQIKGTGSKNAQNALTGSEDKIEEAAEALQTISTSGTTTATAATP